MGENTNNMESLRGALEAAFENNGGSAQAQEVTSTGVAQESPGEAQGSTEGAASMGAGSSSVGAPSASGEAQAAEGQATQPTVTPNAGQSARISEMLQYLMSDNRRLQGELARQREASVQQSELARNTLEGGMRSDIKTAPGAVPPTPTAMPEIPVLNMEEFRYMSSEDQQRAMLDWQTKVQEAATARTKAEVMAELAPMMRDYTANRESAAMAAAKAKVDADSRFADFAGMGEQIDRVIKSTPQLGTMAPEQRYMLGGLIARGINGNAAPKQYSVNEIVEMASKNPDVMRALEARRATEIDEANKDVPVLAGSTGMASASAVPESKAKTFDELKARARKRLGL